MSAWHLAARFLYGRPGHKGTLRDCELAGIAGACGSYGLKHLGRLGMADHNGSKGQWCVWTLTQKGIDYCEGRIVMAPKPWAGGTGRPGLHLVATWLSSLPRGIRLEQRCQAVWPRREVEEFA